VSDSSFNPFEKGKKIQKLSFIDPVAAMKVQSELNSGENILWAGMPNPKIIFHSDDRLAIPFSLLWTGFFVFWEAGALGYWGSNGKSGFMAIWGIPFLVFGQYFVWGRFFIDAWLKRRTYYAVTNQRVLIVQEGWNRDLRFTYLESIPEIVREGTTVGTLWLGPRLPVIAGRRQPTRDTSRFKIDGYVPVLADVNDVESVYRLIMESREKRKSRPDPQVLPTAASRTANFDSPQSA
jgi:hypothetical protein